MAAVFPVDAAANSNINAAGITTLGKASGTLIPALWSPVLIQKFYDATVFAVIANTDYQEEVFGLGDTVHMRTTPDVTIGDYKIGKKLSYQQIETTLVTLQINKGKYFAFAGDDVIQRQADYNFINDTAADATENLTVQIDSDILANVGTAAHADNKGADAGVLSNNKNFGTAAAPRAVNKENVLDVIVDAAVTLNEQNVPTSNRWIILPPDLCGEILKSDLKDASLAGDAESIIRRNGMIGTIANFTVFSSNNLANSQVAGATAYSCLFGHKCAITFAAQISNVEGPLRDRDDFADFYRGLTVYGYKVVKPEALGLLIATKA